MDGLPIFDTTIDGEHVEFVALSADSTVDDVLEMLFVREVIELRATNAKLYETLWDVLRGFLLCAVDAEAIKA